MRSEKEIRKVKKNEDSGDLKYYLSLSYKERLELLENLRSNYIKWNFTDVYKQGFQRIYKVVKRK